MTIMNTRVYITPYEKQTMSQPFKISPPRPFAAIMQMKYYVLRLAAFDYGWAAQRNRDWLRLQEVNPNAFEWVFRWLYLGRMCGDGKSFFQCHTDRSMGPRVSASTIEGSRHDTPL